MHQAFGTYDLDCVPQLNGHPVPIMNHSPAIVFAIPRVLLAAGFVAWASPFFGIGFEGSVPLDLGRTDRSSRSASVLLERHGGGPGPGSGFLLDRGGALPRRAASTSAYRPSSSDRLNLNLITALIGQGKIDEATDALEDFEGPRDDRYFLC